MPFFTPITFSRPKFKFEVTQLSGKYNYDGYIVPLDEIFHTDLTSTLKVAFAFFREHSFNTRNLSKQ